MSLLILDLKRTTNKRNDSYIIKERKRKEKTFKSIMIIATRFSMEMSNCGCHYSFRYIIHFNDRNHKERWSITNKMFYWL